ncbi:blue copper protein-like [Humulus lupulus]|uniref:blue copper protein-like n=1 Tax=Humulus lupulus TaxID=3486 RepID=UPI002B401821|nr:blue copper protein-like [Humulus lupulus]
MGRSSGLKLAILVIAAAALMQFSTAQTTHIVGDGLGWLVPPGGLIAYQIWADTQTFVVGDVLVFKFSDAFQDVARVTKDSFKSCNSSEPISLKTKSSANFTLDTIGEYYFIGTKDKHCNMGQKLAINVTAYPGPTPSPAPTISGPVTYFVGEGLGWFVPPGDSLFYAAWAFGKTFYVGDTLVFNFINGTQDVAVVTENVYKNCTKNNTTAVYATSPVNITLETTGQHFFTSTYSKHCELRQKLAINVTGSSTAKPPSSSSASPSIAESPAASPLANSAPSRMASPYFFTIFFVIFWAFFH